MRPDTDLASFSSDTLIPVPFDSVSYRATESRRLDLTLHHLILGPTLDRSYRDFLVDLVGQHDNRDTRGERIRALKRRHSGAVRKVQVEKHRVDAALSQSGQSLTELTSVLDIEHSLVYGLKPIAEYL